MKPTSNNKQLGRNKFYKNKRGLKITSIVDITSIPFSFAVNYGNSNDAALFDDAFDNILIDTLSEKYENSNKYKQYFLGDSAYDSMKIKNILLQHNRIPIIDINNRNTINNKKKRYLTLKQKEHYKNRIKVENFFAILTQYPKMNMIVEKTIKSFEGFLYLISCNILYNKIQKNIDQSLKR